MTAIFTARRFNQDTARAQRAAEDGPVYVTDRGRPSHVLLSFEEYSRLVEDSDGPRDVLSALGSDAEAAAVDLDIRRTRELPRDVDV
jgi:PHD/YefM family antitoxin component YafN of YafNO toxin-antitoxin module